MKSLFKLFIVLVFTSTPAWGQLTEDPRQCSGGPVMLKPSNPMSRSVANPTTCNGDTSYYPNSTTTAYRIVTIKKGNSLGQYFGTNQSLTVSGFRFYGYAVATNPARKYNIRLICNLYKAGVDSLPTGSPLASDTVTVDTVMGSTIYLNRVVKDAVFNNPVTLNYDYIIAIESDSTAVSAGVITNSWTATTPDGRKKNLGCGSVSGKWYRCLQLNIAGITFDADMQLYPFVKYKLGADFSINNNCFNAIDTVKFNNLHENNVSSLPYYNYYLNYNLGYYCHRWSYDGSLAQNYIVDGFYKPGVKKNFDVRLISVVFSYTSGQCYDTVVKTVYFKPAKPVLKSAAFGCVGDTAQLNVTSDAGVTLNWYYAVSDKAPFNTGNSLTINNIKNSDTFFVQAVNGDCKSPYLLIDFTVSEHPKDPVVFNDSICQGAVANLRASADKGQMEWFESQTGGGVLFTGNDLQTDKLFSDTQFYVQANNKGCYNPSGRLKVSAFVNNSFAPDKPVVNTDTFMCLRPASTLTLSASQSGTDTLRWFDVSSGGSPLGTGNSYTYTPAGREDDVIYVETWNGVCGSGRSAVNIHVYDYPTIFGLRGDTICLGDSAEPFLSVPWGTANWYLGKNDVNPAATGGNPRIGGLASTQKLYISTEEIGCKSPSRDSVLILVNAPPQPQTTTANPVCAKSLGSMEVKVPYGNVNWYYEDTSALPFTQAQKVNTGIMFSSITYYYETEFKGCKSDKKPLTLVVKPRPTAGFTWVLQWQNRLVCTPITVAGLTLSWDWGDGTKTTGAPYIHLYSTKGNYVVRMVATSNSNGCMDTADIPVLIDHTGVNDIFDEQVGFYPVPVKAGAVLTFNDWVADQNMDIFMLNGQVACSVKSVNGVVKLPEHLQTGVYSIRFLTPAGIQRRKLLVAD